MNDRPSVLTNTSPALRRAWHCVAESSEVTDEPQRVWLLGTAWVVVRFDGEVRAFVDRCPHRSAPLSIGRMVGGELQCAYHGWRYDDAGACVAIPAVGPDGRIPSRACLQTPHDVVERFGLVFIAPEVPRHPLPELDFLGDDSFVTASCTTVRTKVAAALLVDNFMDAAHFPFVHGETFGVAEAEEVSGGTVETAGWSVRSTFSAPYRNHDDPAVETGEHPLVQPHKVTKVGHADYITELTLSFELTGGSFRIIYAVTPEREGQTRIYKVIARNDLAHDPDRIRQVASDEDAILLEDLRVLEQFDETTLDLGADVDAGADRREISTRADRLSVAWRRLMAAAIADEPSMSSIWKSP